MQDVMEAPFFKEEAPSPDTMKRKRHNPHVGDAKRVKAGVKPEGREAALGAMVNNTTAKGATAALRPRSVALTGRRVTVYWSGDRKWFNGCVGALQPDGQHMVHYDDGENKEEELDNDGVEWELLLTARHPARRRRSKTDSTTSTPLWSRHPSYRPRYATSASSRGPSWM